MTTSLQNSIRVRYDADMPMLRPAALLATCALANAQEAVAPIAPQVLVETVGPDGWRARLGPTNLGVLLASAEGRALWEPAVAPFLGMWTSISGGPQAYRDASERLFGFRGVVRVAWGMNQQGEAAFAVVIDNDLQTDLRAVAADLRSVIEATTPGQWRPQIIAGEEVMVRERAGTFLSSPRVDGGQMSMLGGESDEPERAAGLRAWLNARPTTLTEPRPGSPAARVTIDLQRAMEFDADERQQPMMKALGLDALRRLVLTISAAGPHLQIGADVEIKGAPRGIVRAFMPPSAGISGLVSLLPDATSVTKVGRFDPRALVSSLLDLAEAELGSAREEAADRFGLELDDDLFAHATDELLVLGQPLRDFDRVREATWGLAWRLRDEAKFRAGFQKVTKQIKGFLSPSETVDVDGVELRRYGNLLRYDVWMAVGNGLWVLTAGRDAEEEATALLRKAASRQWSTVTTPPRGFDDLARYLPAGCNGVARADLAGIADMPIDWWLEAVPDLLPRDLRPQVDEDLAEDQREIVRAMLIANRLSVLRTATGTSDGTWRWRMFW